MFRSTPPSVRSALLLMLFTLGACADDPVAPTIPSTLKPNANLGDIITVTSTSGGKETGSLRWAVAQATGGEIIRFAPALAGATIVVDSTMPILYGNITIEGPADKGVTISGGDAHHVFEIGLSIPQATTFRNLSIVNGEGSGSAGGGAILGSSDVVLENVTLTNNKGDYTAALYLNANATFINTTISNNITGYGYAVLFVGKKLTLVNSTIAYNNKGGVIVPGSLSMRNSIITHNGADKNCRDVSVFERYGKNLTDDLSCGDSTVMIIAPAKLDSLRDNGGPTKTHGLLGPSPAINAGTECTVAVDQRYVPRDAKCDLGAFEFKDFTTATLENNVSLTIDPTTGAVLAAGSVKCSTTEVFDLAVEVVQEQKAGKTPTVVKAIGKVSTACPTTPQAWGLALTPSSGKFEIGSAVVTTTIEGAPWITSATATTPVKLFRGRK